MDKRTLTGIIIAAVLGIIPAAAFFMLPSTPESSSELHGFRHSFATMGTIAAFTLYTSGEAEFIQAVKAGKAEFSAVMKLANLYDTGSELSQLNAAAGKEDFPCSPMMWELLMHARRAWKESEGNFDITVKPLMDLWGFYRKQRRTLPTESEISSALAKVGFHKLHFDETRRTVRFTVPGMALDLGGIAKGYALDRASEAISKCGITRGVLDLGGNLKMLADPPPGKEFYTVGIRDPGRRGAILDFSLQLPGGSAAATSGDYERFVTINGKRYGHIADPKRGIPPAKEAVTVTANSALEADIFSTSCYLGGRSTAKALQQRYPGMRYFFIPDVN